MGIKGRFPYLRTRSFWGFKGGELSQKQYLGSCVRWLSLLGEVIHDDDVCMYRQVPQSVSIPSSPDKFSKASRTCLSPAHVWRLCPISLLIHTRFQTSVRGHCFNLQPKRPEESNGLNGLFPLNISVRSPQWRPEDPSNLHIHKEYTLRTSGPWRRGSRGPFGMWVSK